VCRASCSEVANDSIPDAGLQPLLARSGRSPRGALAVRAGGAGVSGQAWRLAPATRRLQASVRTLSPASARQQVSVRVMAPAVGSVCGWQVARYGRLRGRSPTVRGRREQACTAYRWKARAHRISTAAVAFRTAGCETWQATEEGADSLDAGPALAGVYRGWLQKACVWKSAFASACLRANGRNIVVAAVAVCVHGGGDREAGRVTATRERRAMQN
jgi:hypothetical protein